MVSRSDSNSESDPPALASFTDVDESVLGEFKSFEFSAPVPWSEANDELLLRLVKSAKVEADMPTGFARFSDVGPLSVDGALGSGKEPFSFDAPLWLDESLRRTWMSRVC
jgi:hypothetical protein